MKEQTYINGVPVKDAGAEFRRAQALLVRAGLYRKMGNFGPYYPNKAGLIVDHVETITIEEMEFTIVESAYMGLGGGGGRQQEAWFQPIPEGALK
jgi:hypothetical protein